MTRVIVTGGRAYQHRHFLFKTLDKVLAKHPDLVIVHGACPTGADRWADEWCKERGVKFARWPAKWDKHGPAAGPIRNSEMIEAGASGVVAFPGGSGTADCVAKARAKGIPVMQVGCNNDGRLGRSSEANALLDSLKNAN